MPNIKVIGQTVRAGEPGQTDGRTDGRYQTYYLPATRSIINATFAALTEVAFINGRNQQVDPFKSFLCKLHYVKLPLLFKARVSREHFLQAAFISRSTVHYDLTTVVGSFNSISYPYTN